MRVYEDGGEFHIIATRDELEDLIATVPPLSHLALVSSPVPVTSALARLPHQRATPTPQQATAGGDDGGEVRLRTARMPLAAVELSDDCPPHGIPRPLWEVKG